MKLKSISISILTGTFGLVAGSAIAISATSNPDLVTYPNLSLEPIKIQFVAENPEAPPMMIGDPAELMKELNLTLEQKQRLDAIRDRYKDRLTQAHTASQNAFQEFQTLMAGTASTEQLTEKHRQLVALHQQVDELHFNSMLAMREVLTPEQRTKLAELIKKRFGGFPNPSGPPR